jgi:hypothetical protein
MVDTCSAEFPSPTNYYYSTFEEETESVSTEKKKIIVLGGGTAGWLTALFINKKFPNFSITLIEGDTVGTIGVGEGTTPHIINFLKDIDIDPIHLIKNINGTIKNGISFENWNGDNKKYFHSFAAKNNLYNFNISPIFGYDCYDFYLKNLIKNKLDFNEYVYGAKISYENKIDLNNISYAVHFDTTALSNYLKPIAIKRGINFITGDFKNVNNDNNGFITSLSLTNKKLPIIFSDGKTELEIYSLSERLKTFSGKLLIQGKTYVINGNSELNSEETSSPIITPTYGTDRSSISKKYSVFKTLNYDLSLLGYSDINANHRTFNVKLTILESNKVLTAIFTSSEFTDVKLEQTIYINQVR